MQYIVIYLTPDWPEGYAMEFFDSLEDAESFITSDDNIHETTIIKGEVIV